MCVFLINLNSMILLLGVKHSSYMFLGLIILTICLSGIKYSNYMLLRERTIIYQISSTSISPSCQRYPRTRAFPSRLRGRTGGEREVQDVQDKGVSDKGYRRDTGCRKPRSYG